MKKKKTCEMCGDKFMPNSPTQKYCGSTEYQRGCSWKKFILRKKIKQKKLNDKNRLILKKAKALGIH